MAIETVRISHLLANDNRYNLIRLEELSVDFLRVISFVQDDVCHGDIGETLSIFIQKGE